MERATTLHVLAGFEAAQIDVAGCDRLEICIGLYEMERAGQRIETWPVAVQNKVNQVMAGWRARNADRAIRLVSSGVHARMCVVIVHHAAKPAPAGGIAAETATADEGPPAADHPVAPPPPAGCPDCGG